MHLPFSLLEAVIQITPIKLPPNFVPPPPFSFQGTDQGPSWIFTVFSFIGSFFYGLTLLMTILALIIRSFSYALALLTGRTNILRGKANTALLPVNGVSAMDMNAAGSPGKAVWTALFEDIKMVLGVFVMLVLIPSSFNLILQIMGLIAQTFNDLVAQFH